MKNKKKTYLLLAVVLGVWGLIGFKVLSGINSDAPEIVQNDVSVSFNPKTSKEIDTFSVQAVTRDPFLGTLTRRQTKKVSARTIKTKPFVWLPISYQGMVKTQASKLQVFVVTIKGRQHLLKQGQRMDSVSVVRGNAKSIVVNYKKRKKTIKIQQ